MAESECSVVVFVSVADIGPSSGAWRAVGQWCDALALVVECVSCDGGHYGPISSWRLPLMAS